jgi:hypothetical protein
MRTYIIKIAILVLSIILLSGCYDSWMQASISINAKGLDFQTTVSRIKILLVSRGYKKVDLHNIKYLSEKEINENVNHWYRIELGSEGIGVFIDTSKPDKDMVVLIFRQSDVSYFSNIVVQEYRGLVKDLKDNFGEKQVSADMKTPRGQALLSDK